MDKTDTKYFNPDEWEFQGLWKQDVFSSSCWVSCWRDRAPLMGRFSFPAPMGALLNGGNFFFNKELARGCAEKLKPLLDSGDTASFTALKEEARAVFEKSVASAKQLADIDPTPESFEQMMKGARDIYFYWLAGAVYFVVPAERIFQDAVIEAEVPPQAVSGLIPEFSTPLLARQQELVALKKTLGTRTLEEVLADSSLADQLKEHCKKYAWVEIANWVGEPLSIERLWSQIQDVPDTPVEHETGNTAVPERVTRMAECFSLLGYLKQGGSEHCSMYMERARPFLQKIADRFGITYRELMRLTPKEISDGLAGDSSDITARTQKRELMEWLVFSNPEGEASIIDDPQEVAALTKRMLLLADIQGDTLRGQVAYKGKVQGRACIALNVDDFHKMHTGDVLISTMTTPDFIGLIQKASAIVTDIGGLLSHAAIVSREMKKPCVIGTKHATKVFKDGDMVEVDAEKGIVRKL